jgi:hypothetical protein
MRMMPVNRKRRKKKGKAKLLAPLHPHYRHDGRSVLKSNAGGMEDGRE